MRTLIEEHGGAIATATNCNHYYCRNCSIRTDRTFADRIYRID